MVEGIFNKLALCDAGPFKTAGGSSVTFSSAPLSRLPQLRRELDISAIGFLLCLSLKLSPSSKTSASFVDYLLYCWIYLLKIVHNAKMFSITRRRLSREQLGGSNKDDRGAEGLL